MEGGIGEKISINSRAGSTERVGRGRVGKIIMGLSEKQMC